MIGDKICEWIAGNFPVMCRIVGGMSKWQLVAVGLGMLGLIYVVYAAAWNLWLNITGYALCINDDEPYEDWMDAEIWEAMR